MKKTAILALYAIVLSSSALYASKLDLAAFPDRSVLVSTDSFGFVSGSLSPRVEPLADVDWDDQSNWSVTPFNDGQLMFGLILDATGLGLFSAGGATASMSLSASLIMMNIAGPTSCIGGFLMNSRLSALQEAAVAKGAVIGNEDRDLAQILTYSATGCAAASIVLGIAINGLGGDITSMVLSGAAVLIEITDLYLVRFEWLKKINMALAAVK